MALTRAEPAARRVIKGAARLADRITDKDREAAVGAIRAALDAKLTIFDAINKKLIQPPDHKTQLAAATLLLAYDEGLPVRRIEAIVHNARTPEERMEVLRGSPEMLKAMKAMSGIAVLEMDGEVIDAEFEAVQKTGGENE